MHDTKENTLTDDSNFIVKESKSLNLIAGIILLIVGLAVLYNIFTDYHFDQVGIYKKMIMLSLLPSIILIWKGLKNSVLLTINKSGIFRCGVLLTSWDNFISGNITQDQVTGSIQDNFVLYIDFCTEDQACYVRRKIRLPNTMNKSEEEILEAIRYFCKFSKNHIVQDSGTTSPQDNTLL